MKNFFLIISFFNYSLLVSQTSPTDWADYFYMNNKYDKAIRLYNKSIDSLSMDQERNLAFSYMRLNDNNSATSIYTSITNRSSSGVVDYLTFAQLLPSDSKLAKEYREKAKRLNIHESEVENDSLVYKTRFYDSKSTKLNSMPNNTSEDEFSVFPVTGSFDATEHFTDKNQIEFYYVNSQKMQGESSKKLKNIKSKSPIYNISYAKVDTLTGEIIRDELFQPGVNSKLQEGSVSYDKKYKKLFFTRSIPNSDSEKNYQLNIYQVTYPPEEIGLNPEPIFELKGNYSNMHPTYDSENQVLYFSSDRPGGYGGMDLYSVSFKEEGVIGDPVNMGIDINTDSDEVFPYIYNQDVIFFSSNRKLALGNLDPIMATRVLEDRWSAEALGAPFTSELDDFGFYLDPISKLGFISSNRKGGLGKDDNYYFISKPKVKGLNDKYMFRSDTLVRSFGGVYENDQFLMLSEDPLNTLVEKEVVLFQTPNGGSVNLESNGSFWYVANGSEIKKDTFSYYLETSYSKSEIINVYLDREEEVKLDSQVLVETQSKIDYIFRPIFFEFDSADVWKKYIDRIDEVVKALNLYPNMEIKIKAYTDRRGNAKYNLNLSKYRSKSIANYIKSQIKNPERVKGFGYGEEMVKVKDLGIKVSEEEHQKERRVDFEVSNFQ